MPAKFDPDDPKRSANPSFGLSIWGPLVPASDCKTCLYTLTGLQILGGLYLFWKPGRTPGPRIWVNRLVRTAGILSGTYLIGRAGLEIVRLQLRNDPWADDARIARQKAIDAGQNPSKWFGPAGYRPVDYKEWKQRTEAGLKKAEIVGARVEASKHMYTEIKDKNKQRAEKVLEKLRIENEPKFASGITEHVTADPEWDILGPWETLQDETDILVRLIIHSRGVVEE